MSPLARRARRVRKPVTVTDDFSGRADGSAPGRTSDGSALWRIVSGLWTIQSGKLVTSSAASANPIVGIDIGFNNVNVGADVGGPGGNDAVYARIGATNADWIRAKVREVTVTGTTYCTYTLWGGNSYCCSASNCTSGCGTVSTTWCNPTCSSASFPTGCGGFPLVYTCPGGSFCSNQGTCQQACGTFTEQDHYLDVEKMVGGVRTNLASIFLGAGVSVTHVRVVTTDTTVQVYATVGGVEALKGTYTITDGQANTTHGLGRGSSNSTTLDNTGLDNFSMTGA